MGKDGMRICEHGNNLLDVLALLSFCKRESNN